VSDDQPRSSTADQILSSDNREVQILVAKGLFPLPPHELIPLQIQLTVSEDAEMAAAAAESLQDLDPTIAATVIADASDLEILQYFANNQGHPVVQEAILRHRKSTADVLGSIAPVLSAELQEVLLLRQDLIVDHPVLLERLEENPDLSTYTTRRIREFREHLVKKPKKEPETPAEELEALAEEITDDELEAAISEALARPEEGEKDEITGLTEAQVRSLPIPVRLKLARGAPRTLRTILVKDKNPMVAVAVITGNALGDSEVELIASSRAVVEEVLVAIGRNRQFVRKYFVLHSLVKNPRMSVGMARRFVSRLSVRDLKALSKDRNISHAVRSTAARLYKIKTS
jgi:hypothetical protein